MNMNTQNLDTKSLLEHPNYGLWITNAYNVSIFLFQLHSIDSNGCTYQGTAYTTEIQTLRRLQDNITKVYFPFKQKYFKFAIVIRKARPCPEVPMSRMTVTTITGLKMRRQRGE